MAEYNKGVPGSLASCVKSPCSGRMMQVIVASDDELLRLSHFQRLAIAARACDLSRRKFLDEIADVIYAFTGEIVWANGAPYEVPDIYEVFRYDGCVRWVSSFLDFAEKPPRQLPQRRVLERLRLIDLYLRINHPERAEIIAR